MSNQIDQRIVEMRFDNKAFEKNVATTMSTLDKLKEKLLLKNAGEGFDKLQNKANDVSFEHLVSSVDSLVHGISTKSNILNGIFEEIGAKIVNVFSSALGKVQRMINQVTFDPISTGLSEYELKINSVQVIAANTGVLMRDAMSKYKKSTDSATSSAEKLYSTVTSTGEESIEYIEKAYNTLNNQNDVISESLIRSAEVSSDTLQAAYDVMMGAYGNGAERVQLLGDRYSEIQDTVNSLIYETGSVEGALRALNESGYSYAGTMSIVEEGTYNASNAMMEMSDSISSVSDAMEDMESAEYTMDDINDVLEQLNTYADKTIYNYANMTDAIGQFTVQGVDLYDSLTAVQGMANLAAFTGVDATRAAHVMQEAAKGLATGYINLQDWNSFTTSGGMGGKVFQDQLMATADKLWETDEAYREYVKNATDAAQGLKTVVDDNTSSISSWIDEQGRFRDSLKGGWLNDKVLIETLHKFAGDLSDAEYAARGYTEEEIADIQALGDVAYEAATKSKTFTQMWDAVTEAAQSSWTTTWEYIFGTFYDARNLWTAIGDELSNIIGGFNESRNAALKFWAEDPLGRPAFLQAIANIWDYLKQIFSTFADVWNESFKSLDGEELVDMSTNLLIFSESLSGEKAQKVVSVLGSVFEIFVGILRVAVDAVEFLISAIFGLLGLLTGEFGSGINIIADFASLLKEVIQGIIMVFAILFNFIHEKLTGVESIGMPDEFSQSFIAATDSVIKFIDSLINLEAIANSVLSFFEMIFTAVSAIPVAIIALVYLIDSTTEELLGFSFISIISDFISNIPSYIESIKSLFASFRDAVTNNSILSGIKDFFGQIKISFGQINVNVDRISTIAANAVKILGAIFGAKMLKDILGFTKKTNSVFDWIFGLPDFFKDFFGGISDTVESIGNVTKIEVIKQIAHAILLVAISLAILSLVPTDKLEQVASVMVMVVGGILAIMKMMTKVYDVMPNNALLMSGAGVLAMTTGILILVGALAALTLLVKIADPDDLAFATAILAALIAAMVIITKSLNHIRVTNNILALGAVVLAIVGAVTSLVILVSILSIVAKFNPDGLLIAAAVVGGVLAALLIFIALFATVSMIRFDFRNALALGGALMLVASAIGMLALSIVILTGWITLILMSDVGPTALATAGRIILDSVIAVVVIMAFITLYANTITANKAATIVAVSASLILVVSAIFALAITCAYLSLIPIDNLFKGVIAVLALSASVAIIMAVMESYARRKTALALLAAGATINLIVMAMITLLGGVSLLAMSMSDTEITKVLKIIGVLTLCFAVLLAVIALMSGIGGSGNTRTSTRNMYLNFTGNNPIGKAITSFAILILSLAASLWLLIDALDNLADVAVKYSQDSDMASKISNVFVVIGQALVMGWGSIVDAVETAGVGNTLEDWLVATIDHLISILGRLGLAVVEVVGILAETLIDSIIIILNKIAGTDMATWFDKSTSEVLDEIAGSPLTKIINAILGLIALVIYGVAYGIMNMAGPLVEAMLYLLVSIGYLILYVVVAIGALLAATFGDFDFQYVEGFMNDWDNLWENWWIGTKGLWKTIGAQFKLAFNELAYPIVMFLDWIGEMVTEAGNAYFRLWGYDNMVKEYERPKWIQDYLDDRQAIMNELDELSGITEEDKLESQRILEGGIASSATSTNDILMQYRRDIGELSEDQASAHDILMRYRQDIGALSEDLDRVSSKNYSISMTPQLSTDSSKLGIEMFDAIDRAGKEGVKGLNNAWDIHSPSGEGKTTGENIAEGQVIGYNNFMNSDKAKKYMEAAKQKFGEMAGKVDFSMFDGLDNAKFNTDIQPVINADTSNVGNSLMDSSFGQTFSGMGTGIGSITNKLSTMGEDLGTNTTNLATATASTQEISDALAAEGGKFYDDSDLIDNVEGLRSDISALSSAMSKIKMYLDGNKLVGELVAPLDEALARRSVRVSRTG